MERNVLLQITSLIKLRTAEIQILKLSGLMPKRTEWAEKDLNDLKILRKTFIEKKIIDIFNIDDIVLNIFSFLFTFPDLHEHHLSSFIDYCWINKCCRNHLTSRVKTIVHKNILPREYRYLGPIVFPNCKEVMVTPLSLSALVSSKFPSIERLEVFVKENLPTKNYANVVPKFINRMDNNKDPLVILCTENGVKSKTEKIMKDLGVKRRYDSSVPGKLGQYSFVVGEKKARKRKVRE